MPASASSQDWGCSILHRWRYSSNQSVMLMLNLHAWWLSPAETCTVHTTCTVQYVLLHSTGKIQLLLMSVGLAQAHSITNQLAHRPCVVAKACTICGSAYVPPQGVESPPHAHVGSSVTLTCGVLNLNCKQRVKDIVDTYRCTSTVQL